MFLNVVKSNDSAINSLVSKQDSANHTCYECILHAPTPFPISSSIFTKPLTTYKLLPEHTYVIHISSTAYSITQTNEIENLLLQF